MGTREPTPTWSFAVVLVRQGRRFLLVHERKHGQLWYLPAGRVEPGETWAAGALRETLEETGVPVVLEGVLEIQHTPRVDAARVRVIFVARPLDDTPPKSQRTRSPSRRAGSRARRPPNSRSAAGVRRS